MVVRVTDSGGNPVSGVTIALTAQGGAGILSGAAPVVTDASGLATFPNLSIDKAGTYALLATDGTRVITSTLVRHQRAGQRPASPWWRATGSRLP